MRIVVFSYLLFFAQITFGQDVNFGMNFGTNPFSKFSFTSESDIYLVPDSYYTYVSENIGTGVIVDKSKLFNAVHFGLSLRVSRKKIGLNIEPSMYLEFNRFKFQNPYENIRIMSQRGFRLPIYATYHLVNNPLSVHLNAGFIFSRYNIYDYSQPDLFFYTNEGPAYTQTVNHGENHFKDVFYKKNTGEVTTNFMLGVGKRIKQLDYNLRYVGALQNDLLGSRWQIEFHVNFFFISKDEFNTKNYLYEE
jgi:hypothetical protein